MKIGRRIYYDKETGNVIIDTGERNGSVVPMTVEQEFQTYKALAERVPETVGVLELEYGEYAEDFRQSNGVWVNPDTLTLEFNYPDPNEPEAPPVYRAPLSEKITSLEDENAMIALELVDTQIRLYQAEQDQADLILTLVANGVI